MFYLAFFPCSLDLRSSSCASVSLGYPGALGLADCDLMLSFRHWCWLDDSDGTKTTWGSCGLDNRVLGMHDSKILVLGVSAGLHSVVGGSWGSSKDSQEQKFSAEIDSRTQGTAHNLTLQAVSQAE